MIKLSYKKYTDDKGNTHEFPFINHHELTNKDFIKIQMIEYSNNSKHTVTLSLELADQSGSSFGVSNDTLHHDHDITSTIGTQEQKARNALSQRLIRNTGKGLKNNEQYIKFKYNLHKFDKSIQAHQQLGKWRISQFSTVTKVNEKHVPIPERAIKKSFIALKNIVDQDGVIQTIHYITLGKLTFSTSGLNYKTNKLDHDTMRRWIILPQS